jgi:uncharacterized phage protein (TIGR01671 family)
MQKLKFRAVTPEDLVYSDSHDDLESFFRFHECQPLEQYTGLHDKNGREIFEMDILAVKIVWNELNSSIKREFISRIEFSEHRSAYIFPDNFNISVDESRHDDEMISMEIIGNIHKTPELLK